MNNKYLLGTAVAAALMFGAQAASACAISAWSSATGLTAADTGEPTTPGFNRYSGRCGLKVPNSNGGAGRFVTDTTPASETSYRVRFYYNTGDIAGTSDIFLAENTGGADIIRVAHDGTQLSFFVNGVANPQTVAVTDNRYYSIELAWSAAAGTGALTGTVTGNSGQSATAAVAGTVNFPNLSNAADRIDTARLGLITGTPTVTVPVIFDEFDSRRTQNPGRLCRGDSNNSGSISSSDRSAITSELGIPSVLALGQPDCNESGSVSSTDRSCVTALLAAFATCN
jgi:hypothetical protein